MHFVGTPTGSEAEGDDNEPPLPKVQPNAHYAMSHEEKKKNRVHLTRWIGSHPDDPAVENFTTRLKAHLRTRLLKKPWDGDEDDDTYTQDELREVMIIGNNIYRHSRLRINYTTYDRRRDQDSLNPRTHADIITLSKDDTPNQHPYYYARILNIFHTNVRWKKNSRSAPTTRTMDFLWVRWLALNTTEPGFEFGWKEKQLPRVGFLDPTKDTTAMYGFVDPMEVVRGIHLIVDSVSGTSTNGIPQTIARRPEDNGVDVNYYYVDWFADRDLFMRFRGGGVGHVSTREATNYFLHDRDNVDLKFLAKRVDGAPEIGNNDSPPGEGSGDSEEMVVDIQSPEDAGMHQGETGAEDEASDGDGDSVAGDDDDWNSDVEDLVDHEMAAEGEFLDEAEDGEWEQEVFGSGDESGGEDVDDADIDNEGDDEEEGEEEEEDHEAAEEGDEE